MKLYWLELHCFTVSFYFLIFLQSWVRGVFILMVEMEIDVISALFYPIGILLYLFLV